MTIFDSSVSGYATIVGGTMTRPNDTASYAIGDIVAQSTTAGSCSGVAIAAARVPNATGMLRRCRVKVNDITPWTNAVLKVHVFKFAPTFAAGDNGVFSGNLTESDYLGAFDVTLDRVFSDFVKGVGIPSAGTEVNFDPMTDTKNLFFVIEARSAITSPGANKVFSVIFEVLQN